MNFKVENLNIEVTINNYSSTMPVFFLNSFQKTNNIKCHNPYVLVEITGISWNKDMTPYSYREFQGRVLPYLDTLLDKVVSKVNEILDSNNINVSYYALIGYSLAGLFSLYVSSFDTIFTRFGSISGSLWYPNFVSYFKKHNYDNKIFYISLGDKEKDSHNKLLSRVEECSLDIYKFLGDKAYFEYNSGGHFKDSDIRISKCIRYLTQK